jgi:hypothetical protein
MVEHCTYFDPNFGLLLLNYIENKRAIWESETLMKPDSITWKRVSLSGTTRSNGRWPRR